MRLPFGPPLEADDGPRHLHRLLTFASQLSAIVIGDGMPPPTSNSRSEPADKGDSS